MSMQTPDVELLWFAETGYYHNSRVLPHRHPEYFQIYFVLDGRGKFQLEDEFFEFSSGMFFLVHPNTLHGMSEFQPDSDNMTQLLELKFHVSNREIMDELFRISAPCRGTLELQRDFRAIFLEAIQKEFYYENRLPHLLAAWLYKLINVSKGCSPPNTAEPSRALNPALRIKKYIDDHYSENITLEKIASEIKYSKNYLCRLFREGANMTINDYLNSVRIGKAKELLFQPGLDVEAVSRLCGFNNVFYFNKVFKRLVGIPPGAYRRSELVGSQHVEGPIAAVTTAISTKKIFTYPKYPDDGATF